MAGIQRITDAAAEPVSLTDAKAYLRIDSADTANDALITSLIKAARNHCEQYTRLAFISQTWDLWLDGFPVEKNVHGDPWWDGVRQGALNLLYGANPKIEVPRSPLLAVTRLTTYDTTDTGTDFDTSLLVTDPASRPGRVFLKFGQVWPVNLRPLSSVQLRFTAGFGDSASDMPDDIVQACKLLLAHFYENREPVAEGRSIEMPLSVQALLSPYRVSRI